MTNVPLPSLKSVCCYLNVETKYLDASTISHAICTLDQEIDLRYVHIVMALTAQTEL